jgi:hypothetical protein
VATEDDFINLDSTKIYAVKNLYSYSDGSYKKILGSEINNSKVKKYSKKRMCLNTISFVDQYYPMYAKETN